MTPLELCLLIFQLTTSQGGRPRLICPAIGRSGISTHDLARRSTIYRCLDHSIQICISTHDLARRSTLSLPLFLKIGYISTHDLARRSTMAHHLSSLEITFQLTTSQGGRQKRCNYYSFLKKFQLTTSQGGRRCRKYRR